MDEITAIKIRLITVNPLLVAHIRLTQKYPDLRGNQISEICMYGHVQCACSISQCMIFCVHSRRIHMTEASARRKKSHDLRAGYVHVHAHFFVMYSRMSLIRPLQD